MLVLFPPARLTMKSSPSANKDDIMDRNLPLETVIKHEPSEDPVIKDESSETPVIKQDVSLLPDLSPMTSPPGTLPSKPAQNGTLISPDNFEVFHMSADPNYLQPTPTQDSFPSAPTDQYPQLPAILPAYKRSDWWMDVLGADDLMLVTVLTLDGRTTKTISRYLKISLPPIANQDLDKLDTVYDMQRKVGGMFRGVDMPRSLMPFIAHGLVAGFLSWCTTKEGLRILARAKGADDANGNRAVLRALAIDRRGSGQDICQQFGYTSEWAARQDNQDVWKALLFEWWTHGTVNGAMVPEMGF